MKDEDPAYLQVITYASKLDEQCESFVRSCAMYVEQLERRLNATKLRDLGKAALKMGQSEEGWGKPLQKRSKNFSLGYTLHALSDCAESMTCTETASEMKVCKAVRLLVPHFEDCRQRVESIRETFEDRTTALLHYQIACDIYEEMIEKHGRAVANTHPECLEADVKREKRRRAYEIIVERTREEYPRWHASIGNDMTKSLRDFATTRAMLCQRDAECWNMMLRDPMTAMNKQNVVSTKEKLVLEKNARKVERADKRRQKEKREILKAWKRDAKTAILRGEDVPQMPDTSNNNIVVVEGETEKLKETNGISEQTPITPRSPAMTDLTIKTATSSSLINAETVEKTKEDENEELLDELTENNTRTTNVEQAATLISRPAPAPLLDMRTDESQFLSEKLAETKMNDDEDSEWSD